MTDTFTLPPEDDFLDGCELDFTIDPDDDETAELRALFPDGDASIEGEWRALFEDPELRSIAPRSASEYGVLREAPGSGFDTGIADRLRAFGLKVVEVAGWQTRGSLTFYPKGSVDHHTAGGLSGNAPSLGICINGRTGLPGPLCNVFIARDNTCYVVAAGRANHAGTGGWNGLTGNSSVYGIERENTGVGNEPWREDQRATAAKAHAALLSGIGRDGSWVVQHKEWTSRKIDVWDQSGADMRARTNGHLQVAPAPEPKAPQEDEDMGMVAWIKDDAGANHGYYVSGVFAVHQPSMDAFNYWKYLSAGREVNIPAHGRDGLAILDGPCQNFKLQRVEEWGKYLSDSLAAVGAKVGLPIDVDALAAKLGPLIKAGATKEEIAKAVVAEIAS